MALSTNAGDLLSLTYAAGYARLSERELLAAGIANMLTLLAQSAGAANALATAYSYGLPKLSERDLDAAYAALVCSLSPPSICLAPTGLTAGTATTSSIPVSWTAPANSPSIPITAYLVQW